MDKLIEKVKYIRELNESIQTVNHICSNRDENFVLMALKQEKTKVFIEAQGIAKGLLNPVEKKEKIKR